MLTCFSIFPAVAAVFQPAAPGGLDWHKHDKEDEFFFTQEGKVIIDIDGAGWVELHPQQGYVVPNGAIHKTRAPDKTVVLMVETAGIVPTGDV